MITDDRTGRAGAGLELVLGPRVAERALLGTSAALVLVSLFAAALDHVLGGSLDGARDVIDLNREGSLPTLWSALQLALAASLAAVGAATARRRDEPDRRAWALLALLGVALALDEALALHEYAIEPVREALGVGGLLHHAWVLPGGVVLLALGVGFVRFARRLPRPTRTLLLAGAATLVAGGYGLELVGGLAQDDGPTWLVVALYHVEEALELLGEALVVIALLRHLAPLRLGVGR